MKYNAFGEVEQRQSAGTGGRGVDLGDAAITTVQQVDQMDPALLRRTDSTLDLLGRVKKQTLPSRQDAWGGEWQRDRGRQEGRPGAHGQNGLRRGWQDDPADQRERRDDPVHLRPTATSALSVTLPSLASTIAMSDAYGVDDRGCPGLRLRVEPTGRRASPLQGAGRQGQPVRGSDR